MTKIKMQMLLVGAISCGFGVKQVKCNFSWSKFVAGFLVLVGLKKRLLLDGYGVEGDILK